MRLNRERTQKFFKMEEVNLDLLNIEQEDDNLLGASPFVPSSNECLLSPPMISAACRKVSTDDLENHYGKEFVGGASAAREADVGVKTVPLPFKLPSTPTSVLSDLNINEMNKRRVKTEELRSRKGCGAKESMHLNGIAESCPVEHPKPFTSQLKRSYCDIENEQSAATPEKGSEEAIRSRKNRNRRSVTLRKSLAWDQAFFTDEGVLDNDELFAVASDTREALTIPELATIGNEEQNLIAPFELSTTPVNDRSQLEVRSQVLPENLSINFRLVVCSIPEQDIVDTPSVRSVRQVPSTGSQMFSNAYSNAAAIPQGCTSIPLPNRLLRTLNQPGGSGSHPTEHAPRINSDGMNKPRNATASPQRRLISSNQSRIAASHQTRIGALEKQPQNMDIQPPDEIHKMHVTPAKLPMLTRSMSTPRLQESPSSLSRKVSSMSRKVKETLGKVMTGRARRVPKEPSLSHATVLKKDTLDSNRSVAELNVPDRMRSNMPLISVKVNDEVCTVGEVFRLRGPSPSSKIDQRQAPSLMRSKSTHSGVPGLPRAADAEVARDTAPSQSVASSQSLRKPSGLRKPSPKLGFF